MPDEDYEDESTATEPSAQDQEGSVTDAELLAALGLDNNLKPIGAKPESPKAQGKPARKAAPPASGDNAEDEEEESPEEEEDADEESEESDDEEDEEETEEEEQGEEDEEAPKPKGIAKMQKRIDKLTAQRHELEEQLGKAKAITLTPTEEDPLSDLQTEADVREYVGAMRRLRRWCLENLEGGDISDEKGETTELSARQVRARLAHAEEIIQDHAPARIEYLRARTGFDEIARKSYPALFENSSIEAKMLANFVGLCPAILRVPNYRVIIGDAIRGMRARLATETGKAGSKGASKAGLNGLEKPSAKALKLAPRAIRPGGSPTQQRTKNAGAVKRLERDFLATGNKKTLVKMIEASL